MRSRARACSSVAEENGQAIIELKNTANYEMDFAADEITERFVRGDAARSTEGSGLGLAIAKSYTGPAAARSMSRWTAISLRCVSAFRCTV